MKHLLVATDFSLGAAQAIALAGELARAAGAEVSVVHVASGAPGPGRHAVSELLAGGDEASLDEGAQRRIADEVAQLQLQSVVATVAVLHGDPVEAILSFARAHGCDAICLGRSPRSSRQPGLGRVAERLVRESPLPVLLAPLTTAQGR